MLAIRQIRVRVGPLESLAVTTAEIARGDLTTRSRVKSGDEFELLGESIDAMARRLEIGFKSVEQLRTIAESLKSWVEIPRRRALRV